MVEEQGSRLMRNAMRTLMPGDVNSAIELSTAANWNQTSEDWCRVMQLSPATCRCVEDGEKVIATTTLMPYDTRLAWIGMVLTRPEYRRQGLARRLMEDAILSAERRGTHTLKLDATEEGRPLYESLGFVVEKIVERWGRDGDEQTSVKPDLDPEQSHVHSLQLSEQLLATDTDAFGVSRKKLLELLVKSGEGNAAEDGYVLSRPGKTARYLGPCVARSEAEAHQLISAHLGLKENGGSNSPSWYWDLLPTNSAAIWCAKELGFTRRRVLWRMQRGKAMENNDAMVYAIAGFELG
jgi:predicted GNAT family N-acyltransferase